jgi:hypothetical protein
MVTALTDDYAKQNADNLYVFTRMLYVYGCEYCIWLVTAILVIIYTCNVRKIRKAAEADRCTHYFCNKQEDFEEH